MLKVWAVELQGEDSWGTNNDSYETVSLHSTEENAKKKAATLQLDMAVYFLTQGECDDSSLGPDKIMGILERCNDGEVHDELKEKIAKPGADFWKVFMKTATKISDDYTYDCTMRTAQVKEMKLED